MENVKKQPNEIIKFLEGTWVDSDIIVAPSEKPKTQEYVEIMKIKDHETLTITAIGYDKEKDLTRDMTIKMIDDKVTLS